MADRELAFAPAWRIKEMVASKEVSVSEVVDLFLKRIEKLDGKLHSYLTVSADVACKQAREAQTAVDKGEKLGLLHGVPVSVKDLEFTKDIRTTFGCYVYRDFVPEEDSVVVERLNKAGAIILGKTNTPEFGQAGTTENRLGEPCRNPWNTERTSGGSSGGAGAALIAGLCSLATGSDGGGSIRIPSSYCGVYGIKPSQRRVPRYGSVGRGPAVANLTSQSGPMSRSVKDSALMLQAISGHDPRDPISLKGPIPDFLSGLDKGVKDLKIGWSPDFGYAPVDPEVLGITQKAAQRFEELGAGVEEVKVGLDDPFNAWFTLFSTACGASYGFLLEGHAAELTAYARYSMEHGIRLKAADYANALHVTFLVQNRFNELLDQYDLLLSPTMPTAAFPVGQEPTRIGGRRVRPILAYMPFTYTINLSGHPAANVPCGFSSEGLPVGLHVIGRYKDEATVLRASAAYEQAFPWQDKLPPVS